VKPSPLKIYQYILGEPPPHRIYHYRL